MTTYYYQIGGTEPGKWKTTIRQKWQGSTDHFVGRLVVDELRAAIDDGSLVFPHRIDLFLCEDTPANRRHNSDGLHAPIVVTRYELILGPSKTPALEPKPGTPP